MKSFFEAVGIVTIIVLIAVGIVYGGSRYIDYSFQKQQERRDSDRYWDDYYKDMGVCTNIKITMYESHTCHMVFRDAKDNVRWMEVRYNSFAPLYIRKFRLERGGRCPNIIPVEWKSIEEVEKETRPPSK